MEQLDQSVIDIALRIWSYEIFQIDGTPMTAGKLVMGIFLLIVGYWASRRAADAIDRRFISRLEIELSIRHTFRRILFYFFLSIVTLSTLRALNVPITVFTVLGGALAIGFGFGSQNVVNNFISGVILMIERPVKVGDFIEVEGLRGTIETIGIRATQVRTPENRHVVLPNSFFLEKAVVNWTLTDDIVRQKITVGVAYGSNLDLTRDLMLEVCSVHLDILKDPAPSVVFADFGDSALIFHLFFWIRMENGRAPMEIESDIRFAMHRRFSEAKIEIPFPQRDVRVHWQNPPNSVGPSHS